MDNFFVGKPTVFLGTLKAGDRFWFRGDWQTDSGTYTLDGFNDLNFPIVKEFKIRCLGDTGSWFANVPVVLVDTE
jgi:hypothetical protein